MKNIIHMIYKVRYGNGALVEEEKLVEAPTFLSAVEVAEAYREKHHKSLGGAVIQEISEVGELEIK